MSAAIFISYTNRDEEGRAWSQQIADWLKGWGYESLFLQKDPQHGVLPAAEWRSTLYRRLHQCPAVIAICSPQ